MEKARRNKEFFLGSLPVTAIDKFDGYINDSLHSKYAAVKGLVNLHNCENVEVHTGTNAKWSSIPTNARMLRVLPEQYHLGANYCAPKLTEYDKIVLEQDMKGISENCRWGTPVAELYPDFRNQMNRLAVPCLGTWYYTWVRSGRVISLGELFEHLHSQYTARQIYYLYLHLDIVSVKRRKPGPKNRMAHTDLGDR
jgi:hypothetical protein